MNMNTMNDEDRKSWTALSRTIRGLVESEQLEPLAGKRGREEFEESEQPCKRHRQGVRQNPPVSLYKPNNNEIERIEIERIRLFEQSCRMSHRDVLKRMLNIV